MTLSAKSPALRYDEGCLAAHALNLIGDRWALLVVRELFFAPKRFQSIRAGLPGVTASVLSARLAQLARDGILREDPPPGHYALSPAGLRLLPVLEALCRWGVTMPGHAPSRFISPSALMISMGCHVVAAQAARLGLQIRARFDCGAEVFALDLAAGQLQTRRVFPEPGQDKKAAAGQDADLGDAPDFCLQGDANSLAAAVYGQQSLAETLAQGRVRLQGNAVAAAAFLAVFNLRPDREGDPAQV